MVFIADICLNFRTGYVLEGLSDGPGKDDVLVEFDRNKVAWNYGTSWFILDVISGVPFALIELILGELAGGDDDGSGGSSTGGGQLKSLKSLKLLRFLKLGRLLKLEKILSSLDQDTLDRIEDFANNGRTQTVAMCAKLLLLMTFSCHIMGCFWVLVGRYSLNNGATSWLETDINGPFDMTDTTAGKNVYSIYLAAFYFSLTTMTSIGYGEITPKNNAERLFAVFLEICGAIIYGKRPAPSCMLAHFRSLAVFRHHLIFLRLLLLLFISLFVHLLCYSCISLFYISRTLSLSLSRAPSLCSWCGVNLHCPSFWFLTCRSASIIANITSLITSTDANTRNKKEQLEMVASFCEARNFPHDMARNIRRHFRR
jgi:hypothetical protein